LRRSQTCDLGFEIGCHPELARRLKIDIWFCDPHQSAEKQSPDCFLFCLIPGSADRTKTPAEAFADEIAKSEQNVAVGT
jgi:hypothetical protein